MKKAAAFLLALCLAASSVAGPFGYYFAKAGGASAVPSLALDFTTAAADSRLTISGGTGGTRVDSTGTLVAASAPRFDYDPVTLAARGLLVEEQRTNSLRNNTGQGAVAGSPGTLPTNTFGGALAGVTRTLSVLTVNGMPVVRYRFQGTATGNVDIQFESSASIAALSGQTWTASLYGTLSAGALSGVTPTLIVSEWAADGSTFLASSTQGVTIGSGALAGQRYALTRTLNNASTAFTTTTLRFGVAGAVDFTVDLSLPQLELGAFATSPILTSGTAVTRTADSVSMTGTNFSQWFNQSAGTFIAEGDPGAGIGAVSQSIFEADDGTTNNRHVVFKEPSGGKAQGQLTVGGSATTIDTATVWTAATAGKYAYAYAAGDAASVFNAGTPATATPATMPACTQMVIGNTSAANRAWGGHIKRIRYFPSRLPNASLQSLTA